MRRLLGSLAFVVCVGCFGAADAEPSELPAAAHALTLPDGCAVERGGPGALSCGDGGCQATWVGCGDVSPSVAYAVECVAFPELGEWRCYWPG